VETKPAYKTTEFWVSVGTSIGSIALAVADVLPTKWAAIATTVSTGAYAISRGLAKSGVTPTR
jgi:hypothetical protein